jgi:prepilin-type N-terminal cleavage/methylation domain-containing protein
MRRAFSLIEVLVAVALLAAVAGILYSFLSGLAASRARALKYARQQSAASVLIERVEADLSSCLVGDSATGAGVAGDEREIRILSRGVAAGLAERGAGDPRVLGDLQASEYRFNESGRVIEARKGAVSTDAAGDAEPFWPVSDELFRVRFRYYDGAQWRESFDSLAAGRLPHAVEIAIWFRPWPGPPDDALPSEEEDDFAARLTFDAGGGFDESEFAALGESEIEIPPPDRVRVIAVPDPEGEESENPQPDDVDAEGAS